ncbi:MAG: restriction endonuclease [Jatrophihabitantaceae bacterium]
MQRRLTLAETGEPQTAQLTEDEAAALTATGLAIAQRTAIVGKWQVAAARKVGTLQVGPDLQVTVAPKVLIERLVFMMGYVRDPTFWRDAPVALPQHDDLPEALAHTFHRFATKAIEQGLLHGYRTVDDSLHVVRGRIRTDDQLRLRHQMPLPIEVRYDEFTPDIAENQILLAATLRLLRMPQVAPATRAGLHRLRLLLADVTPFRNGSPLPSWRPSRLNRRYQPALHVAQLIITASSFEQLGASREIEVSGFLFDAWKIFEDFACVALAEAMADPSGRVEYQHRGRLDIDGAIAIEPDFTWWHGTRPVVVVDAKYKTAKSLRFPNADTYQVLAYCTALGLNDGHLVYAKGEAQQRDYRVRCSAITIHAHALNLAASPQSLLSQMGAVAERIRATASMPPSTIERLLHPAVTVDLTHPVGPVGVDHRDM